MLDLAPRAPANQIAALLDELPVVLAPMEAVTNASYRRICRSLGASLCVTEFVGAEQLIADSSIARRRAHLPADDRPTAIQIYGADPDLLLQAALIAESAEPTFARASLYSVTAYFSCLGSSWVQTVRQTFCSSAV